MKLLKHIAHLGYGSRKQVAAMLRDGRITDADGNELDADSRVEHERIHLDGEPLDIAPGFVAMLHKPVGYTCSTKDAGRLIYDLLPSRWRAREPAVSTVGRLDRDTSGLLLLTDDGAMLHKIISPRAQVEKIYEAELAQDLRGDEAALFASGTLMLDSETTPLAPARLDVLAPRRARLVLSEGRYHQVRRMFAATGNHVVALHRAAIGALTLGDLPSGQWRALDAGDIAAVFQPPPD
jgi:16S rRNA pseudouridine516 synthase